MLPEPKLPGTTTNRSPKRLLQVGGVLLLTLIAAVSIRIALHDGEPSSPPTTIPISLGTDSANLADQASPPPQPEMPPVDLAKADGPLVPEETVPVSSADLERLEEKFRRVATALRPTVVGVMSPTEALQVKKGRHYPGASGVIIRPDGLVLSQWHVSHAKGDRNVSYEATATHQPGEKTIVILADGRECPAKLLGAMPGSPDLSLLQILSPGPFPYAPLKPGIRVRVGDWIVKIGHPMGYRQDRPAVVRSGRVIACHEDGFIADCPVSGGDSGSPYFDLQGNLVGLLYRGWPDLIDLLPKDEMLAQRSAGKNVPLWSALSNSTINRFVGRMLAGELSTSTADASSELNFEREIWLKRPDKPVAAEYWSQASAVLAAFQPVVKTSAGSVVTILNGTVPVALGTVVEAGGWVITKASELPPQPQCQLPDGTVVSPRVVGVDLAFDLALLQVPQAETLKPITWSRSVAPEVGSLIVAPDAAGNPLAAGILSVARRDLTAPKSPTYKLPLRVQAAPPEINFMENAGGEKGYLVLRATGLALAAGIRKGDLIQTIASRPVRNFKDFRNCVKDHLSGDTVTIELLRDDKPINLRLPLQAGDYGANFRRDDFPTIFEHALPIMLNECGGPLLDLSGHALGITIARVGSSGCLAIPGDSVQQLLPVLRSGKMAGNWAEPAAGDMAR